MTEIDAQAVLKTMLCSHPGCPDDAEKGAGTCRRHTGLPSMASTERLMREYDPVNGCKIAGCGGTPAQTRGLYAYLCEQHAREKRAEGGQQQREAPRRIHEGGLEPIIAGRSTTAPKRPAEIAISLTRIARDLERAQAKYDAARTDLNRAKRAWKDALADAQGAG